MLKTRIITALVLVSAFLPALFLSSAIAWAIGMLVISLLALFEWARLINVTHTSAVVYTTICGALGTIVLFMMKVNGLHWMLYQSLTAFIVALGFWLLIVPVLLTKYVVVQNKLLLLVFGFLLITPLWLALVSTKLLDPKLLLVLLSTIWIADTAAYFTGKQFGKHKLAPSISPGKTWEGVLGALIVVSIFGGILYFSMQFTLWQYCLFYG